MDPLASGMVEERALLRTRYDGAVSNILNILDSDPEAAYSENQLKNLGVELQSFDPKDPNFLNSKSCLFQYALQRSTRAVY